jgi:RHS repeat-associated protein
LKNKLHKSDGWQINLLGPVTRSAITDELGYYTFNNLQPGSYTVSQNIPESWTILVPVWSGIHSLTLTEGQILSNVDFADFDLQRYNSDMEYIQFPNGLNIGDNTLIGPPTGISESAPISTAQIPPNSCHVSVNSSGFTPDTIYANKNSIVQFALTSTDDWVHIFEFDDPKMQGAILGTAGHETRMKNWKLYNVENGEVLRFHCNIPGSDEFGYLIIESDPLSLTLTAPVKNSIITSDSVRFEWNTVPGATKYELYVDNNHGLGSPEISKQHIPDLVNLSDTHYTISGNWLSENVYYWKVLAIIGADTIKSPLDSFIYQPIKRPIPEWVPFYRTFNPNVVDHFYCANHDHIQTAKSQGYKFEKTEGFVSHKPFQTTDLKNIFRFYKTDDVNPRASFHYYTIDETDKDQKIIDGWVYEGITGYCYGNYHENTVKLYHLELNQTTPDIRRDHFYTTSEIEKNNAINKFGYEDRGFIGYVSLDGGKTTVPRTEAQPEIGMGIDPLNGTLSHVSKTSFSIPEGNVALSFIHFYNTGLINLLNPVSPLGTGWNHNYNISLSISGDIIIVFWPSEINIYDRKTRKPLTKGIYDTLIWQTDKIYRIKTKNQIEYTFEMMYENDSTAVLTAITDRNNNIIRLIHDEYRRLVSVKTPSDRSLDFTYFSETGKNNLIRSVTDPLNRTVMFEYDDNNNLIQFTDAKNQSTQYEYGISDFGLYLKKITYPRGNYVINEYDSISHKITAQKVNNAGIEQSIIISNPSANKFDMTDGRGNTMSFISNDKADKIVQTITPSGKVEYEFNDTIRNPYKPNRIIDAKGNATAIVYDAKGNVLHITQPLSVTHQFTYNGLNDLEEYIDPLGKQTTYGYTSGNLSSVITPRGRYTILNNTNGTIQSITDPILQTTRFGFDQYWNTTSITNNLDFATTFEYDLAGRGMLVKNAKNQQTRYTYDENDLVRQITNPDSKIIGYSYNANDLLLSVTDPSGHSTTIAYNIDDQTESVSNELDDKVSYTYYDNGQLKTKTTPNGHLFNYLYDNSGRLTETNAPGLKYTMEYDSLNNLINITDINLRQMTFAYDALNRLVSYTDYFGKTIEYTYDANSNIETIKYAEGKVVTYTYYDDNLLNTVTDFNTKLTKYYYRDDGSLLEIIYPNNTTATYGYDEASRLISLVNKKPDNSIISSYTYQLDEIGNHNSVSINEPLGLVLPSPQNVTYSYNNVNRITQAGSTTFSFDKNGNQLQEVGNATSTFTYDALNRLTGISGGKDASYDYDAFGNRRAATRNGQTVRYVLDITGAMSNVLIETDDSGSPLYYYIYGLGLISRIKATDSSESYYHYDSRGSTIAITDENRNITHKYAYDAFGEVVKIEEPISEFNPFRYVGKYGVMYEDSSLYFMRARYYNPDIGRFLSEDPIWDVNLYAYVGNNPAISIDPEGLFEFDQNEWKNTKQQILRRQLLYYMEESAKQEQREMKLEKWVIFAEGIESLSAFGFSIAGGGPGLGFAQAGIKGVYGMFTNNNEMVLGSTIDLVIKSASYLVSDGTAGLIKTTLNESSGTINAAKIYVGFGTSSGLKTIKGRIMR